MPFFVAEFLFYKTNICPSNTIIQSLGCCCMFFQITAILQGVYTAVFIILMSVMHYNSNAYYILMISAAELKNVRSHKVQLEFYAW